VTLGDFIELGYKEIRLLKHQIFGYTWGEKSNSALGDEVELEFLIKGIRR
tara:strand:+ start:587 stop:736 length:150 start_codon:yes stop_codon:yes gene_type:complete